MNGTMLDLCGHSSIWLKVVPCHCCYSDSFKSKYRAFHWFGIARTVLCIGRLRDKGCMAEDIWKRIENAFLNELVGRTESLFFATDHDYQTTVSAEPLIFVSVLNCKRCALVTITLRNCSIRYSKAWLMSTLTSWHTSAWDMVCI